MNSLMDDLAQSRTLAGIRKKIDALDKKLLQLLLARGDLVEDIAAAKCDSVFLPIRPAREAQQMVQLVQWYDANAPSFQLASLLAIWREIMSGALAQQAIFTIVTNIINATSARAHFGGGLPYKIVENAGSQLTQCAKLHDGVVILSADDETWCRFVPHDNIAVFNCIAPSIASAPPIFALGRVPLAPSGIDDATLCRASDAQSKNIKNAHKIWSLNDNVALVEIDGFLSNTEFIQVYGDDLCWLGNYPRLPMVSAKE